MNAVELFEIVKQDLIKWGDNHPTSAEDEGIVFLRRKPADWIEAENHWEIFLNQAHWEERLIRYYEFEDRLDVVEAIRNLADLEAFAYLVMDVVVSEDNWRKYFKSYSACANCDADEMMLFDADHPFDPLCYGCAQDIYEQQAELGDDPNNRIQFYEWAKEIMERDLA